MTVNKVNINESSEIRLSEIAELKKEVKDKDLLIEHLNNKLIKYSLKMFSKEAQIFNLKKGLKGLLGDIDKEKQSTSEILDIQERVCAYFGVRLDKLTGSRREKRYVTARHIAMYLCREANFSYPDIGKAFGNRDHTSVMHAVKKVETREDLKSIIEEIGK